MNPWGRLLIILGLGLIATGALISFSTKIPWIGHLPGDIHIEKSGSSFYFPLTTCILLSLFLSLIVHLLHK